MAISVPNIKIANNVKYILCAIRKKWIVLTPEEKVRQYILQVFINEGYPQKYISVEKMLKVNDLSKRYDIVVFNRQLQPKILIECKAEFIDISEKTLRQIATYNTQLQVPFLMVTNGKAHYRFLIENNTSTQLLHFPTFDEL
ncbi:MAG: type I restriction enzyme HsdR N-terminal domain-containing protein [Chitinophagales bacterium]